MIRYNGGQVGRKKLSKGRSTVSTSELEGEPILHKESSAVETDPALNVQPTLSSQTDAIAAFVDERYGRMMDAFAPGTEVLRGAIASALQARIADIVEYASKRTQHHKASEPLSAREVAEWEQETNATRGLQLIAHWIATGEAPTKARVESIAVVGRRAATVTGQISRIVEANLACRDAAIAVVSSAAKELGAPGELLAGLLEGIHFAIERALVAMAKEFDSQLESDRQEKSSLENLIKEISVMDPASGLYNERSFLEMMNSRLQDRARGPQNDAVVLIWLRLLGLPPVDQGASKGQLDEIVGAVAGRLKRLARPMDLVGRTGQLEYAVFCDAIPVPRAEEIAMKLATRILGSLAHPVRTSQGTLHVTGRAVGTWATGPLHNAERLFLRSKELASTQQPSQGEEPLVLQLGSLAAAMP